MGTRLNEQHRSLLDRLARDLVKCPDEEAALAAAYKAAAPLVRKIVETRFPPKDMWICAKYDAAERDDGIRLQLTAGGIEQFAFTPETGPFTVRSCQIYLADDATTDAVTSWVQARDAFKEAREARRSDYWALIRTARTLEQVAEVWPEAEMIRPKIEGRSLVTLSDEVVERIRADVATRAA